MVPHPTLMSKVLLLLSLMAAGVLGGCPVPSLLHPCTCDLHGRLSHVTCANFSSFHDLQKVFDDTLQYRFDEFYLEHSSIPYLNSSWFALKKIRMLHLSNVTLVGLFAQPPVDPLPLVDTISVVNCVLLRRVQWPDFKGFVQLHALNIEATEVKELGRGFRENVSPELFELSLKKTKTTGLEDGVFGGKKKLEWIDFPYGRVSTLKNSYFEDQKKSMNGLDFSYNPIESLPDDLFQGFEKLFRVAIDGAKIKTLSRNLFENVHSNFKLKFSFKENPLACDCNMKWIVTKSAWISIRGTCDSPAPLKSKRLKKLREKDFDACRRRNDLHFEH